jgi:hypothetical protein
MVKTRILIGLFGLSVCAAAGHACDARAEGAPLLPAITPTGTLITADDRLAIIIGPDGVTERTYRIHDCLPSENPHPSRTCAPHQARLLGIRREGIVVEKDGRRFQLGIGKGPKAAPGERYLTRQDVVESVCGNFAGTACGEVGAIEAEKGKPVQFIIYPMCFEVFVQDWRRQGAECLRQAMYILRYVAYIEFF